MTERPTDEALLAAVADSQAAGASRKDAIAEVATAYAIGRRELYNLVVGTPR
jgi:16S rRNA (cytidine1402-2'-O)-methyltransferase